MTDTPDTLTGPALAGTVAIEVMGWAVHHRNTAYYVQADKRDKLCEKVEAMIDQFRPDRDWAAAGMVEDEIERRGLKIEYADILREITDPGGDAEGWWELAHAAPEQRCRAALKCVRAGKETK